MLADSHGVLKGTPPPTVQLSDEERALLTAVTNGDVNETQRLLSVPGRASLVVNVEGDSLLHIACRTPTDRIIAAIARLKPDLNVVNKKGRAPLHDLGACGGSLAILGSLVKLGADAFARDHMGRTPADEITNEKLRADFEKWLSTHNYFPPNSEKKQQTKPVPVFTKVRG